MTTFAFVHGAYHRGAHFARVVEVLRADGHKAVAPDLPATDPDAGAAGYARVVAEAIGDASDVVVVGHSLGGLTAPLVATLRPVRRIIYLAALVPEPGRSFDDVSWQDPAINASYAVQTVPFASEDGSASVGPARAGEVFFHDASWRQKQWAVSLLRPQQWRVLQEPCPLTAMPDVENRFVVCRADRVVDPDWSVRIARERFGTEPVMLDGGHCPMVARPAELARVLSAASL